MYPASRTNAVLASGRGPQIVLSRPATKPLTGRTVSPAGILCSAPGSPRMIAGQAVVAYPWCFTEAELWAPESTVDHGLAFPVEEAR